MFWFSHASDGTANSAMHRRVAGITIKATTFKTTSSASQEGQGAVLWWVLEDCVVPAEQRAHRHAHFGSSDDNGIPSPLMAIDVEFSKNTPTINHITAEYPAIVRSLRLLKIENNSYDESAELGAFAVLATHLRELTFYGCGLTSLSGLGEGRCEYLQRLNISSCYHLSCLESLSDRAFLQEVELSITGIITLEPLCSCPALTKVSLRGCYQLGSLDGLSHHVYLKEVNASYTGIASIEPLRTCPALTKVDLTNCRHIASIEPFEDHQWLEEVELSNIGIPSIEPLRTCPALTKVVLYGCQQLSSMEALADHQRLKIVDATGTAIASVEPLYTCPALTMVVLFNYTHLLSVDGLQALRREGLIIHF